MDWLWLGCSVATSVIHASSSLRSLDAFSHDGTDDFEGNDFAKANDIDYGKIIDELSDEALGFSVTHIYSTFFFYNRLVKNGNEENRCDYDLKAELDKLCNMSRDDFKKELHTFIKSHVLTSIKAHGTMNYYMNILSQYLNNILICKSGTRAEKYKKRALEAVARAGKTGMLEDVDDAFFVFAALLNTMSGDTEKFIVGEPSFQLTGDAEEIYRKLSENCEKIQKKFAAKRKSKGHIYTINYCPPETFINVNNILFLARAIQNFGIFEEKHDG